MYLDDLKDYVMQELFATAENRELEEIRDAPEPNVTAGGVDANAIDTIVHPILVSKGFRKYLLYRDSLNKRLYGRIIPDGRTQFLTVTWDDDAFNPHEHLDAIIANCAHTGYIKGPPWGVSPHAL